MRVNLPAENLYKIIPAFDLIIFNEYSQIYYYCLISQGYHNRYETIFKLFKQIDLTSI